MEFKVGDKVDWMGLEGEVVRVVQGGTYPLVVKVSDTLTLLTTLDGRTHISHTKPSLVLIERPKKKKTITLYRYTQLGLNGGYTQTYWTSTQTNGGFIIHTETKEIEVDCES